jgi:hypothetical protein
VKPIDEEAVRVAYVKVWSGEKLSYVEKRLLQKYEKAKEALAADALLSAIPAALWRRLSGVDRRTIEKFAARYSLPMAGDTIDLGLFLPRLFAFMAENWLKFGKEVSLEAAMAGDGTSPALERFRNAQADRAELDVAARRREVLPRAETREMMLRVAMIYRNGEEALTRSFGPAVGAEFERMNREAVAEIKRTFPEAQEPDGDTLEDPAGFKKEDRA